jgi:ubiquitin-conjugating enzyme E2 Q
MPPDLIGDNLYQWIVEMHSFDPALPLAKDLKAK